MEPAGTVARARNGRAGVLPQGCTEPAGTVAWAKRPPQVDAGVRGAPGHRPQNLPGPWQWQGCTLGGVGGPAVPRERGRSLPEPVRGHRRTHPECE